MVLGFKSNFKWFEIDLKVFEITFNKTIVA
jgi:hypothetical protein